MKVVQVLRGYPRNLRIKFEPDGNLTDADGPVTVAITRADGSVLEAAGVATRVSLGTYDYALVAQANLDYLTATWSATVAGNPVAPVSYVEVVGGAYVNEAELRALKNIEDPAKYSDDALEAARRWFEQTFEDYTGVAWVPRYARTTLHGTGDSSLVLPHLRPRPGTVRSVRVYTTPTAFTAFTADELAGLTTDFGGRLRRWSGWFPAGVVVVVEYEHGFDAPPPDVVEAAKDAIRRRLLADRSGRDPYLVAAEGLVQRFSRPGPGHPFGIDDVDEVANRRRMTGEFASVPIL